MAWLTLGCALLDLAGRRWFVRIASAREWVTLSHDDLIALGRASHFIQNLGALFGLITLTSTLTGFLHPAAPVPTPQRVGLAGFAGVFLPTVFLSTILPVERTTPIVVLVACGAASFLAVLFALGALRWSAPPALRLGAIALAFAAFFGFAATVFLTLSRLVLWDVGYALGMTFRQIGEVAWLLSLLAFVLTSWPRQRPRSVQLGVLVGCALATAAMLWGLGAMHRRASPQLFSDLAYGASHLDLALESHPVLYLGAFATLFTFGLAGLGASVASRRHSAAGLIFLVCAGYAPTTPLTLLFQSLGVAFIARAMVGEAMQRGQATLQPLHELDAELEAAPEVPSGPSDAEPTTH
ncbi:MAG: hypothetical protein KF901_26635 [Myxococcales bacterium]|nr:hypothetical protein [Myxococcales bacterium]